MLKMMYSVLSEKKQAELQWLKDQKIYASCEDFTDWMSEDGKTFTFESTEKTRFGMIVDNDAALAIKLRHSKVTQTEYRKK